MSASLYPAAHCSVAAGGPAEQMPAQQAAYGGAGGARGEGPERRPAPPRAAALLCGRIAGVAPRRSAGLVPHRPAGRMVSRVLSAITARRVRHQRPEAASRAAA